MKYAKDIIADLLKNGKHDLPRWSKDEFVSACILDFHVSLRTAEKVYTGYHEALNNR